MTCSLKDLPKKVPARVVAVQGEPSLVCCLMDMGIRNNILVKIIGKLFFGSNYIVKVGNEHLVLRRREAQCLKVTTSF